MSEEGEQTNLANETHANERQVDDTAKLVAAVIQTPEVQQAISNNANNITTSQSGDADAAAVQSNTADAVQSGDDAAAAAVQSEAADNSAKIADDSKSQDEKDADQAELDKLKPSTVTETAAESDGSSGGRRRTKRKQQKKGGKSAKKGGKKHRKSSGKKSRRSSSKKSRRQGRK